MSNEGKQRNEHQSTLNSTSSTSSHETIKANQNITSANTSITDPTTASISKADMATITKTEIRTIRKLNIKNSPITQMSLHNQLLLKCKLDQVVQQKNCPKTCCSTTNDSKLINKKTANNELYIYGGAVNLEEVEARFIFDLMLIVNEFELIELSNRLETILIKDKASYSDFTTLPESALISLLKRDDLQIKVEIWGYAMKWEIARILLPLQILEIGPRKISRIRNYFTAMPTIYSLLSYYNTDLFYMWKKKMNDYNVQDLCKSIPGLYRMLDLRKGDGSNGLVDKIIVSQSNVKKLCNDIISGSFKSISKVNYEKLNSCHIHLIGIYGRNSLIAKFLLNKKIIDEKIYKLLLMPYDDNSGIRPTAELRPGIYLLRLPSEKTNLKKNEFMVIHWSENECYKDKASSHCKENMTNLHRYLTKITERQICLMDNYELKNIDWKRYESKSKSEDQINNKEIIDFKVKKNERKENLNIDPGFEVYHSELILRPHPADGHYENIPLDPLIVESVSNPTLLTRQIIPQKSTTHLIDEDYEASELHDFLQKKQHYSLKINPNIPIKKVKIIFKNGFKGLKNSVYSDLLDLFEKSNKNDYLNKIDKFVNKLLYENYSNFETKYSKEMSYVLNVEDISIKSSKIHEKFQTKIDKIDHDGWIGLKKRYIFAQKHVKSLNLLEGDILYIPCIEKVVLDEEVNLLNLVKKYSKKNDSVVCEFISEIENETIAIADKEFVRTIHTEKFLNMFFEKYKEWRKLILPIKLRQIFYDYIEKLQPPDNLLHIIELEKNEKAPYPNYRLFMKHESNFRMKCEIKEYHPTKLLISLHETQLNQSDKFEMEKDENFIPKPIFQGKNSFEINLEIYDFKHIAQLNKKFLLEKNEKAPYPNYRLFMKHESNFRMKCEIKEYHPTKLLISLHETQLNQSDKFEMEKDENFIPKPIFQGKNSFEINLEIYDFKHIAQLNKKFLVLLWNKDNTRLELYFGDIKRISAALHVQNPFHKLYLEHFMVTVNERKGLIAFYDTVKGSLNVYTFNQEQTEIYPYENTRLQQWYNNKIPDITHFLFIKNTDDLCFVERNGQARIYNLNNASFQPGKSQLPINTNLVLSTPDGTCFVAFTTEGASTNEINVNHIRAYVYLCEKLTKNAIKVIDIPFTNPTVDLFRFSLLNNKQIYLTTIDQQNGKFQSVLVKMTQPETSYQFEQVEKFSGQVKFEDACPFFVFGKNTKFAQYVQKGDFIIIGDEKRVITQIKTDIELKIEDLFKSVEPEKFYNFKIKSRNFLNSLLDIYSMVFTKYAINNPIGKIDKSLTVFVALDIKNAYYYSEKFSEYFDKMWKKFKEETKKPIGHIKNFKSSVIPYQHLDNIHDLSTDYLLGEWLIDFFCLIPIQIAITRDNRFIPLRDGLSYSDNNCRSIGSVSKEISFGWYEAIFDYYSNLELKVISSMGEQSCGKRYLLNHCLGTTFDGSTMHCSEGVWMSLVKTSDILYVALYFEGGIKRSAQEETFLLFLNAALSDLVLFKSHFAATKDITMFQRFQDGANYFGEDLDIFQARLCIVMKDVKTIDRNEIVEEFQNKFSKIVEKGEENYLITKLFGNEMSIIPYPVLDESDFYTNLDCFKEQLDDRKTIYKNAGIFIEKIKILMTKLKVCDWGSIQATLLTMRTDELKKFMNNAISFGFEQKEKDPFYEHDDEQEQTVKKLTNRDDGLIITDDEILISKIFDHVNSSVKLMPDTGLELLNDQKNFVQISSDIIKFFENNIYSRKSILESKWVDHLKAFFKFIIDRRITRVNEWVAKNISRFPKDHNEIIITNYALEQEITNLNSFWNLCCIQCDKCDLKCLKSSFHSDNGDVEHSCLTDHLCHSKEAHVDEVLPEYQTCGAPCIYYGKRNCQGICTKETGHENTQNNEIHLCDATRHHCGEPCSLKTETQKGSYQCKNTCIIPCGEQHELHKCQNEACPIECPLENCQQRCGNSNHFHADEKDVNHFCGQEHQCPKECEEKGICKIVTEPAAVEHDDFTLNKYSQTFQRLPCCIKIPPYKFEHDGKHVHEIKIPHLCNYDCPNDEGRHIKEEENNKNFHSCDVKCPNCSYYCTLPYGHYEKYYTKHSTTHGSMFITTFAREDEFKFEGQLNFGDKDFVLCHKLCEGIGRHRHIDYCRDSQVCSNLVKKEGLYEHIKANINPKPDEAKDYISHWLFWERTMFEDPYSNYNCEEFKKCDCECPNPNEAHNIDEKQKQKSIKFCCTQNIFHPSLDPNSASLDNGWSAV
ncbi:hypothetical protein Glove_141g84 [Diversispora epigaea]|uniref:VWFA domain-containing protein n=1 Tax=Diversispora epigaea TaxID=1348612 RepID=A0A397J3Q8_9GLOM|nr:hypothetical protein Glove_141g84 [Diversispora epigaea]